MSGAYTLAPSGRLDSENSLAGSTTGNYNSAEKLAVQLVTTGATGGQVTYTAGTPQAITWSAIAIAKIQWYWFTVDQGTLANPIIAAFACSTGTIYVPMVAGVPIYWDGSQLAYTNAGVSTLAIPTGGIFNGSETGGTYTSSGTSVTGLTLNIPSALGLASPGTVNFTGRIALSP